jgi:hypothetical protein
MRPAPGRLLAVLVGLSRRQRPALPDSDVQDDADPGEGCFQDETVEVNGVR